MSEIDWVLVPSVWWENSPLVIQEAFQHGRPVICSDIGGMAEQVRNGVDGLHFRVGDPASLAETIERAAMTPRLWYRLRDGISPVRPIEEHVATLTRLYGELIERRGRRVGVRAARRAMVIGERFAWAHLPKTGGMATERMFRLFPALIVFADPDDTDEKHATFRARRRMLDGKLLAMNLRRLPFWVLSRAQYVSREGIWPDYDPIPMAPAAELAGELVPRQPHPPLHGRRAVHDRALAADGVAGRGLPALRVGVHRRERRAARRRPRPRPGEHAGVRPPAGGMVHGETRCGGCTSATLPGPRSRTSCTAGWSSWLSVARRRARACGKGARARASPARRAA